MNFVQDIRLSYCSVLYQQCPDRMSGQDRHASRKARRGRLRACLSILSEQLERLLSETRERTLSPMQSSVMESNLLTPESEQDIASYPIKTLRGDAHSRRAFVFCCPGGVCRRTGGVFCISRVLPPYYVKFDAKSVLAGKGSAAACTGMHRAAPKAAAAKREAAFLFPQSTEKAQEDSLRRRLGQSLHKVRASKGGFQSRNFAQEKEFLFWFRIVVFLIAPARV